MIKLGEMIMILDLYRQGLHPASKLVAIARTPRRSIQLSCCNSTVLRKRLTRSALRLVSLPKEGQFMSIEKFFSAPATQPETAPSAPPASSPPAAGRRESPRRWSAQAGSAAEPG